MRAATRRGRLSEDYSQHVQSFDSIIGEPIQIESGPEMALIKLAGDGWTE